MLPYLTGCCCNISYIFVFIVETLLCLFQLGLSSCIDFTVRMAADMPFVTVMAALTS